MCANMPFAIAHFCGLLAEHFCGLLAELNACARACVSVELRTCITRAYACACLQMCAVFVHALACVRWLWPGSLQAHLLRSALPKLSDQVLAHAAAAVMNASVHSKGHIAGSNIHMCSKKRERMLQHQR